MTQIGTRGGVSLIPDTLLGVELSVVNNLWATLHIYSETVDFVRSQQGVQLTEQRMGVFNTMIIML